VGFDERVAECTICSSSTRVSIIFYIYLVYAKHIPSTGPPGGLIESYILVLEDIA
jgi:hypothetical protein